MSCKLQVAATIGFFVLLLTGSAATADSLPVGFLSFDQFSNGYALDLTNLTLPGGASPVTTFLDLSLFTLTVNYADGSSSMAPLSEDPVAGVFGTGAIFSLGQVISAQLTGTFSPTTVQLFDGSTVAIDSTSTTPFSDSAGALVGGDFALVNVNTEPQAASEPDTLLQLAVGLAGLLLLLFRSRARFLLDSAAGAQNVT